MNAAVQTGQPLISRDQFIREYCERAGKDWDTLRQHRSCHRCHCAFDGCQGWGMTTNSVREDWEPGGYYYRDGDPLPFDGPLD
jgi:hypothetical protein